VSALPQLDFSGLKDAKARVVGVMSFKKNFVMSSAANFALAAIGTATGILAARLLGPQGRGELAAITAFSGTVSAIALVGVPNALIYYAARTPKRSSSYLVAGGLIAIAAAVPFALGAYFCIPVLLAHQRAGVIWAARIYVFQIAVYLFASSPGEVLRGAGHFRQWNVLRVAPRILVLSIYGLAWVLRIRAAEFIAIGNIVAGALMVFPLWYWLLPVLQGPPRPTLQQGQEILRFSLPTVFTMLPKSLNLGLDQIVMSAMLPAPMLGLYVAAVSWSASSGLLLQAVGNTLFPHIASITDDTARSKSLARAIRLTTLIAVVMMLVFLAATPVAVPLLFGRSFVRSVPAGLVLVIAGLFAGLNMVLEEGIQGLGHPTAILRAEIVGLAVTVVALAALLKPLQIMGAAIASLLTYATVTAVLLYQVRELTGLGTSDFICPGMSDLRYSWLGIRTSLANLGQRFDRANDLGACPSNTKSRV
jgi:O-antigen/teichoic acid export membrane protein